MEKGKYTKGEVAKTLGGGTEKPENEAIGKLFSFCSQMQNKGEGELSTSRHDTSTRKKRKMPSSDTPVKHRKKKRKQQSTEDNRDEEASRPRRNRKHRDPEQEQRTVFVGNLPNSVSTKDVQKLFKKHGAIESVRLRSAAPADPKARKRVVVINKEFHPSVQSINAYVVFKEKEGAAESLIMNGSVFQDHHLRVDLATGAKKHDTRKSIFIGNLPFDAKEELLWQHFEDCGQIENIRLVRDACTRIGKGIAYVTFEDASSVSLALKLNGHKLQGRKLRIQRAVKKEKVKKNLTDDKVKQGGKHKTGSPQGKMGRQKGPAATAFTKSKSTSASFQGVTASQETRKGLKKKKQKKMKANNKLKNQIYLSGQDKFKKPKEKANDGPEAKHKVFNK